MPTRTIDTMLSSLSHDGRPLSTFKKNSRIVGAGQMSLRRGYSYVLEENPGSLPPGFDPDLSPGEMLMLGVFEGRYLNDCIREFPADWFIGAISFGSLSPESANPECNLFKLKSRQSLTIWRENGWVPSPLVPSPLVPSSNSKKSQSLLADPSNPDERGWFQWYCRFWLGRRIPALDDIQIKRWRSFRRHAGAIRANCTRGSLSCRPRERQALLQWAYNPFI